MKSAGEPVPTIAETLGVSRATIYRLLSENDSSTTERTTV
jgi:predicted DNA-binding transcriptional regulator AlpA